MTVGLPPDHEVILSPGQLKSRDLRRIIHSAYGGDESMAMLTQVTIFGVSKNKSSICKLLVLFFSASESVSVSALVQGRLGAVQRKAPSLITSAQEEKPFSPQLLQ